MNNMMNKLNGISRIAIFVSLKTYLIDIYNKIINYIKPNKIIEPEIQELMTLTTLSYHEIIRIKKSFYMYTSDNEKLTLEQFLNIPGIIHNPLKLQISKIFSLNDSNEINFNTFISTLALFNCIGKKGQKLNILFKIQDIDNDGMISKSDLYQYIQMITYNKLNDDEINILVMNVLEECSSHSNNEYLTFTDFAKVVAPTDFHIKLHLPI